METQRFDRLSRSIGSRRTLGLALGAATLLGLVDDTSARRRRKNCKKWRVKFSCRGACETFRTSSCGDKKRCTCTGGTTCLSNKSCGLACPPECPAGCSCASGDQQVCVTANLSCDLTPRFCSSLGDCPAGTVCDDTRCGPGGDIERRCVRTCPV